MRVEQDGCYLEVAGDADGVTVTLGEGEAFTAYCLTPDETRQLHTDLGEMLGKFEE